ncbi:MAG: hypothetical protein ABI378_09065 [Chitinophagaceae bacterium]
MRKFLFLFIVLLLLVVSGYVYWNYYNVLSDGTREGMVQKFSRQGNVFKTWEGEMVQQGFGTRGGNFNAHYFYFSVVDEGVADSLEHGAQGKIVRVHFLQYRRSLPWRGDNYNDKNPDHGQYIVDRIEEVRDAQY